MCDGGGGGVKQIRHCPFGEGINKAPCDWRRGGEGGSERIFL